MKRYYPLLTLCLLITLVSCTEFSGEPEINPEEQRAQKYIDESEAAVAEATQEIKDFELEWISTRSTVVVPAGSVDALAAAIAEAGVGGTVVLASGEHTENATIVIDQKVKIEGESGATLLFPNAATPAPVPIEIIPAIHIKDATRVWLKGFSISPGTAAGRYAVFIQDGPRSRVEDLTIAGFQHGIFIDGGDRCQIIGNTLVGVYAEYPVGLIQWGITNSTGQRTVIFNNEIANFNVGIFFSDRSGLAFSNIVAGGDVGIIWCNVPLWQVYPNGEGVSAASPATGWRGYSNTAIGAIFNFLIVDGAQSAIAIQNHSIDAGLYDYEIAGESQRFGFTTPSSNNSLVISVGPYTDARIKDCTGDNTIIGGSLIDTSADPCF
jgi:hypothetical protein